MPASSIKLLSLDLETTMRADRKGFSSATPWDTNNRILCFSAQCSDGTSSNDVNVWPSSLLNLQQFILSVDNATDSTYLVGHNIKFDLIYLKTRIPEVYELLRFMPMWDTQIAEYLISGQLHQFPSLKNCCALQALLLKSDTLTAAIAAGKTTEDIDPKELLDYCINDAAITLDLAKVQMHQLIEEENYALFNLIVMQSNVSRVLAEMEVNGIRFDGHKNLMAMVDVSTKIACITNDIWTAVDALLTDMVVQGVRDAFHVEFAENVIGSNRFWSCYLFGGDYEFEWREPNGEWKSGPNKGKTRYKKMTSTLKFQQWLSPSLIGTTRNKNGDWGVDESILRSCGQTVTDNLLEYRRLNKLLNTYLSSLPNKAWGGVLHPAIHQTSTRTGRLSQSNPNLQNVANEPIVKSCFVPSSPDLCFVEADYKQLEMNVFAMLYPDPDLLNDIRAGIDIHTMIGQQLYGTSFNQDLRRKVKGVVFGMIYGGGAKTLSEQVGLSEANVKKVIKAFDARYPSLLGLRRAKLGQLTADAQAGKVLRMGTTYEGLANGIYARIESVSGRRYHIELDKRVTPHGVSLEPHYTAFCNYPVQGLATGDIVPLMLLTIRDRILKEEKPINMINTVHDSILFEVPKCEADQLALWIQDVLSSASEVAEEMFPDLNTHGIRLPVSVKVSDDSWAGPWRDVHPF